MRYSVAVVLLVLGVPCLVHAHQPDAGEQPACPEQPACSEQKAVVEETAPPPEPRNFIITLQDELFLSAMAMTAWGIFSWDWFQSKPHFSFEAGLTSSSGTGGADKIGHGYVGFLLSDIYWHQLHKKGFDRARAAFWGAVGSMIIMTYIEIGDMFSSFGFSLEDLAADLAGATLSWFTNRFPLADALIDFRVGYMPSSGYLENGDPVADYSGMTFNLAFLVAGMGPLGRTPLKYIELHLGFYSRGFQDFDDEEVTERVLYLGLGINFVEFFRPLMPKVLKRPVNTIFSYFQIPYTSWEVYSWEGRATVAPEE